MSDKISYSCHGNIAILTVQNPPVNALSQPVRQGLWDGMDRAESEQGIRAIMIVGEGRAFFAGADITEFGKPPLKPHLPDLINRIVVTFADSRFNAWSIAGWGVGGRSRVPL